LYHHPPVRPQPQHSRSILPITSRSAWRLLDAFSLRPVLPTVLYQTSRIVGPPFAKESSSGGVSLMIHTSSTSTTRLQIKRMISSATARFSTSCRKHSSRHRTGSGPARESVRCHAVRNMIDAAARQHIVIVDHDNADIILRRRRGRYGERRRGAALPLPPPLMWLA
jgi:hypothetical protein